MEDANILYPIPFPRRSARVILLDRDSRVLLIRYVVDGYIFWVTPGGAVEPGEQDIAAAQRELYEELRLHAGLLGPVHFATGRFHHEGRYVENTDVFFTATIAAAPMPTYGITAFESGCMKESRWWTLDELRSTTENVFPRDLADVVHLLQTQPR